MCAGTNKKAVAVMKLWALRRVDLIDFADGNRIKRDENSINETTTKDIVLKVPGSLG